jgi:SNF2 family DNA or RNA helicase
MNYDPLPYQTEATDWLLGHRHAALFTGTGLGKTAACLAAIVKLLEECEIRGVLVVAPLRVSVLTWPNEIAKWDQFRWLKVANLRTEEGNRTLERGGAHIYTVNYESLVKTLHRHVFSNGSHDLPVDMVVFDELTKMKAPGAKRVRAMFKACPRFAWRWGLTGTPAPESLLNLFSQVKMLDLGRRLGKSFHHYRQTWFYSTDWNQYNWKAKKDSQGEIEKKLADLALVQKASDHLNLPDTTVHHVDVPLGAHQKEYDKLEARMLMDFQDTRVEAVNSAVLVNKLLQFTSGRIYGEDRKVAEVHDKKLEALVKIPTPVIVGVCYRHEVSAILKRFVSAETWQGDATLKRWNEGKIRMLVAHPASIGHGLNLQEGGRRICWYTLPWSRELYDQFNARVIRLGQEEPTEIYHLLCPGTVDEAVLETLRCKAHEQSALMDAVKNLQKMRALS